MRNFQKWVSVFGLMFLSVISHDKTQIAIFLSAMFIVIAMPETREQGR